MPALSPISIDQDKQVGWFHCQNTIHNIEKYLAPHLLARIIETLIPPSTTQVELNCNTNTFSRLFPYQLFSLARTPSEYFPLRTIRFFISKLLFHLSLIMVNCFNCIYKQ